MWETVGSTCTTVFTVCGALPTLGKESCPLFPRRNCVFARCQGQESGMQTESWQEELLASSPEGSHAREGGGAGCRPFSTCLS